GRRESDSAPPSSKRPAWNASTPVTSRASAPALPQSRGPSGSRRPRTPAPWTTSVSTSSSSTRTPSARTTARVDSVSPLRPQRETRVSPSVSAPTRSARCEIDLSPGTPMWPSIRAAGSTRIQHRRDDDGVPERAEHVRHPLGRSGGRDEERERAAELGRDVLHVEVLDVHALRAERLRHLRERSRAVGDVDAEL